jgi:hypothetical protein
MPGYSAGEDVINTPLAIGQFFHIVTNSHCFIFSKDIAFTGKCISTTKVAKLIIVRNVNFL